ncbi:MAG: hypothetical protein ABSA05_02345 [Opitutaceae bacterium]|jgi:hypothetical protein
MMTNIPKRQRLLIIGAGACVALLVLDKLVFSPLGDLWDAHSAEIDKLRQSVARGESMIARAAVTRQTWAGMQSGALARDQAQSEYDVIAAIEGWGRTSNVELGSIKPVWKHGANDSYSLLECRLDASGTLPALTRFMYELGRSPLALRADSVELASRDDTGDILTLGLTITGLRLAPLEEKK